MRVFNAKERVGKGGHGRAGDRWDIGERGGTRGGVKRGEWGSERAGD